MSSLSKATVKRLTNIRRHPNADSLCVSSIDGFPIVFKENQYVENDLVIYIPPDLVVDASKPGLEFLLGHEHLKPKKLRGILSYGVLIKAYDGMVEGQDVTDELNVKPYVREIENVQIGEAKEIPLGIVTYTDIESLRKYNDVLSIGESVVVTEKVDGSQTRYIYQDDKFYVGSHKRWVEEGENIFWRGANQLNIKEKLSQFPNLMFCGETYGNVNKLKYGHNKGEVSVRFYDIYDVANGNYLSFDCFEELCNRLELPIVPILYVGDYLGIDHLRPFADGESHLNNAIKEGFVVKPTVERRDDRIGRVVLKYHSDAYLSL